MNVLEKIKKEVVEFLWPVRCVGCGKEGSVICAKCSVFVGEASLICPFCNGGSISGERHQNCKSRYGLDGLINIWEYEGVIKKALMCLKYNGVSVFAKQLVEQSISVLKNDAVRFNAFYYLLSCDSAVTFVPMSKNKEKKRGFNQAQILAGELALSTGKQEYSLLKKMRETQSQTELSKKERQQNVKNSFIPISSLENVKDLILVDDIWTTGATMKECCRVLKMAGAKNVWGFTIARAV